MATILALGLGLGATLQPVHEARGQGAVDPDALFQEAREAYDAGEWDRAIARYRTMVAAGYEAPALWFNLGNALARAEDEAGAVWSYARALREAPRDEDIRANLRFVQGRVGAPPPEPGRVPGRWLRRVSRREWTGTIRAGYGLAAIGVGLVCWRRRGRRAWRVMAWLGALVAAVGLGGVGSWAAWDREPQAVIMAAGLSARYAPVADHTVAFEVPYAALVRVERAENGWSMIRLGARSGWVPDRGLARVEQGWLREGVRE